MKNAETSKLPWENSGSGGNLWNGKVGKDLKFKFETETGFLIFNFKNLNAKLDMVLFIFIALLTKFEKVRFTTKY